MFLEEVSHAVMMDYIRFLNTAPLFHGTKKELTQNNEPAPFV